MPTCGRDGGVPCRERWKAFILASILGGNCPPLGAGALEPAAGTFGLRAFCNIPNGVEEAVIDFVVSGSAGRREGSRGGYEESAGGSDEGLLKGESSSGSGEGV